MKDRERPTYCTGRVRMDFNVQRKCPRCHGELPIGYPGAISRYDNRTEICSDCGTAEAIIEFQHSKEGDSNAQRDKERGSTEKA